MWRRVVWYMSTNISADLLYPSSRQKTDIFVPKTSQYLAEDFEENHEKDDGGTGPRAEI
jgi:hypothetical protein